MSNPGGVSLGDAKTPIGGHVLAHASTTRLYFRKGKGNERICKVQDSPILKAGDCVFEIDDDGIRDCD